MQTPSSKSRISDNARTGEVATPHANSHALNRNTEALQAELEWLSNYIQIRLKKHFSNANSKTAPLPAPPRLSAQSNYGRLINEIGLATEARLVLALALAPFFQPSILDPFLVVNPGTNKPFSEFGGRLSPTQNTFRPTGETALFLTSGNDYTARIHNFELFDPAHALFTEFSVSLSPPIDDGPRLTGLLRVPDAQAKFLSTGKKETPHYSMNFPAHKLETKLQWSDLVLAPEVLDQINHIVSWIEHEDKILTDWELNKLLAPGYRALFHGPSGTGKTLTVSLLGQRTGLDVFRVDLSMMVSKFIGETEKNLANIFDQAANKNWILFFDEADALFGKRTSTTSSNDKYANQEVAYLLQRIETCPSVVILATNLRSNIDDAFYRRFQSMIGFTKPDAKQRYELWKNALADKIPLGPEINLKELADNFELVGGSIVNIVRYAAINALRDGKDHISQSDLRAGISREIHKEGRTI